MNGNISALHDAEGHKVIATSAPSTGAWKQPPPPDAPRNEAPAVASNGHAAESLQAMPASGIAQQAAAAPKGYFLGEADDNVLDSVKWVTSASPQPINGASQAGQVNGQQPHAPVGNAGLITQVNAQPRGAEGVAQADASPHAAAAERVIASSNATGEEASDGVTHAAAPPKQEVGYVMGAVESVKSAAGAVVATMQRAVGVGGAKDEHDLGPADASNGVSHGAAPVKQTVLPDAPAAHAAPASATAPLAHSETNGAPSTAAEPSKTYFQGAVESVKGVADAAVDSVKGAAEAVVDTVKWAVGAGPTDDAANGAHATTDRGHAVGSTTEKKSVLENVTEKFEDAREYTVDQATWAVGQDDLVASALQPTTDAARDQIRAAAAHAVVPDRKGKGGNNDGVEAGAGVHKKESKGCFGAIADTFRSCGLCCKSKKQQLQDGAEDKASAVRRK